MAEVFAGGGAECAPTYCAASGHAPTYQNLLDVYGGSADERQMFI